MITLERAKGLRPGDLVYMTTYTPNGKTERTMWTVYTPPAHRRFDNDNTIICYLTDKRGYGIQSYVFSTELHRYQATYINH